MKINESILKSLASISTDEAIEKLRSYAKKIKRIILSENTDDRYESLTLLEEFAFRVPKESISIVEILASSENEKAATKYTTPFIRTGYKHEYVLEKCVDILLQYGVRYAEFDKTFDLLLKFYCYKIEDKEYTRFRKKALEALMELANYNLNIVRPKNTTWVNYRYQVLTLKKIKKLLSSKDNRMFDVALSLIGRLFEVELEGTEWNDKTVTMTRCQPFLTPSFKKLRKDLISLLIGRIKLEQNVLRKQKLVGALEGSTKYPINYSDDFELFIMQNTKQVLDFFKRFRVKEENPTVIQEVDEQLAWITRRFDSYKGKNAASANALLEQANDLRKEFHRDSSYALYRTLVRDNRHDVAEDGGWEEFQRKLNGEIANLLEKIDQNNAVEWANRLNKIISTYELKDDYEFQNLRFLLRKLGEQKPNVSYKIFKQLETKDNRKSFLTDLLMGIKASGRSEIADRVISQWLKSGEFAYYQEIPHIYSFMEHKNLSKFDLGVFDRLVRIKMSNINRKELDTRLLNFLPWVYKIHKSRFHELLSILLERAVGDDLTRVSWSLTMSEYRKHINLNELPMSLLEVLINKYLSKQDIHHHDEEILAVYGKRNLLKLVNFFKQRVILESKDRDAHHYDAIPYHLGGLKKVFVESKNYEKAIRQVLNEWIMSENGRLRFEGRQLLHRISPKIDEKLKKVFWIYIKSSKRKALAILEVLREYEGDASIDDLCMEVIRRYEGKEILDDLFIALYSTGMVSGEYGFYNAHKERRDRVAHWKHGNNKRLKSFIKYFVETISKEMEQEKKTVEVRESLIKSGVDAF